jgi:DNA (cytosine-5)-methyltransferase 1
MKSSNSFTTISFFCGAGGMDLGFRGDFIYKGEYYPKLPFETIAAYDIDAKSVETYKRNISPLVEVKDLSNFDVPSIPKADVLIGGFPCQDFSTCGTREGLTSDRGKLYLALVKYMREHKPKVVIGENVQGLLTLGKGKVIEIILSDLKSCGYNFELWTLCAPNYGVPQNRKRVFLVGVRSDLPNFPEFPEFPEFENNHRSIKWAIEDLESITDESVPNQSQFFKAAKAKGGKGQGDEVSKPDKPGYTVRANAKSRIQFHYSLDRRLTVRECARLQTFPDNFHFPHSATDNIMQIGNAVPPVLAHAVGEAISNYLTQIGE